MFTPEPWTIFLNVTEDIQMWSSFCRSNSSPGPWKMPLPLLAVWMPGRLGGGLSSCGVWSTNINWTFGRWPFWGHVGWSFFQCSTMSLCHWDLYQVIQELCSNAVISLTSHTLMSRVGVLWVPNPHLHISWFLYVSFTPHFLRCVSSLKLTKSFTSVRFCWRVWGYTWWKDGGNLGCFWWWCGDVVLVP